MDEMTDLPTLTAALAEIVNSANNGPHLVCIHKVRLHGPALLEALG